MDADKKLLMDAGKAAGMELSEHPAGDVGQMIDGLFYVWNPLEDDGDALRLAVKLGMEVYVDNHPRGCACTEAQSHTHKRPDNAMRSIVNHDADPYAATRRAIVIAAAEIGRSSIGSSSGEGCRE